MHMCYSPFSYLRTTLAVLPFLVMGIVGIACPAQAANVSIELTCGGNRFVVPKVNATDALRKQCQDYTDVKNAFAPMLKAMPHSSFYLTCLIPAGFLKNGHRMSPYPPVTLGAARIRMDKVNAFMQLCSSYRNEIMHSPEVVAGGAPLTQNIQAAKAGFMKDTEGFLAEESPLEHQADRVERQRMALVNSIAQAGGGYKIVQNLMKPPIFSPGGMYYVR